MTPYRIVKINFSMEITYGYLGYDGSRRRVFERKCSSTWDKET
jgi:hypothetical protein